MNVFSYVVHEVFKRPYKLAKTIDVGQGKTVLLLHGIGTSGHSWDPLLNIVDTKKCRFIAYDLLGFGQSPRPKSRAYTVEDHAESVLASLDKRAKNGKIIIIGHSMGCLIASHIATLRPKLVEHLILYEPPLFADSPEFRSHARRKKLYFALFEEILRRPQTIYGYSKLMARFAENRVLTVDESTWYAFERSLKNTIMQQQAYRELKKITTPTDIIYGKFDFLVTRSSVKKMLQSNTHITFHLVNEMHEISKRAARYIDRLLKPLY